MILSSSLLIGKLAKGSIFSKEHWLCTHNIKDTGYGCLNIQNNSFNVHRLSAHLFLGLNLENKKLQALHKNSCPYKNCWKPDCLDIGTIANKFRDAIIKYGKMGFAGPKERRKFCFKGLHELKKGNI